MNKILQKQYATAKSTGRVCSHCGWIITVKNWKKGYRLCAGCFDAMQGVNVKTGHFAPRDEPSEKTGEMI